MSLLSCDKKMMARSSCISKCDYFAFLVVSVGMDAISATAGKLLGEKENGELDGLGFQPH